jgi:hypothetical protein
MSDLLTPENLSKDILKDMYDAAFMNTSFDDDGDLRVGDGGIKCYVFPKEKHIKLMSIFGAEEGAEHSALVEFANQINLEYIIVRVAISDKDSIFFESTIPIDGGITQKAVVLATKQFLSIPVQTIVEHGKDLVKW